MSLPSAEFKQQAQAAFAAAQAGQTYTYRRTFTDGDLSAFCGLTGDFNPFHLDEIFAQGALFGRRVLPGLLPASMVTHIGGMLGFLAAEMHFEFLRPVYVGDTVTCTVQVTEKDAEARRLRCEARLTNQAGELVIRARFSGFPTQPRLQPDTAGI
ncbi:hypothetical protein GCM10017783_00390 [Deinococcus piscis]|uniref:MaoC-like domain-containing protein n=1 Tax=Deinococcus piscis TaxID=394230 RepID=A0ABQ3JXH8_9DEIO|nr:MaoC family dehydratase [Deinococcus piscis]GHF92548.1 hypothetical protein GCM10017783_00390 [Deinococcus piscis]